jgi:cysteine desulfurase
VRPGARPGTLCGVIHLDHAATTPPRAAALAALTHWLERDDVGNASAAHSAGRTAREAVEHAREEVAAALGAAPADVIFTSGGTEADNVAVKGLAWAGAAAGRRHLVTTAVEHPAVLEAARWMASHQGFALTEVAPRPDGTVDVEAVLAAVRDDTALVAVMWANNELGAINDVAAIGAALADRPAAFHTDAVQAFATQPVRVDDSHCDALALSAHKFGGPQGVGVAVARRGVPIEPLTHGGGQDRGVRSGTFAAALDAACGAAVTAAVGDRPDLAARARRHTDRLAEGLLALDGVTRNGPADPAQRLPTHLHVSVAGVDGDALTLALDRAGLAAAAGAACTAGAVKASHVLVACGITADATLRLSVGHTTTDADIDGALDVLTDVIPRLRAGRPVVA